MVQQTGVSLEVGPGPHPNGIKGAARLRRAKTGLMTQWVGLVFWEHIRGMGPAVGDREAWFLISWQFLRGFASGGGRPQSKTPFPPRVPMITLPFGLNSALPRPLGVASAVQGGSLLLSWAHLAEGYSGARSVQVLKQDQVQECQAFPSPPAETGFNRTGLATGL